MNEWRLLDEEIRRLLSSRDFGLGHEKGFGGFHEVQILLKKRELTRHNRPQASQVGFQLKVQRGLICQVGWGS